MNATRLSAVVVPLGIFALATALLTWSGLGFHDQVLHTWVTRTQTLHFRSQTLVASAHSRAALVVLCAFLGAVWGLVVVYCVAFMSWGWRGYP